MEIWLTYLAALLMAGATAFAFPSSAAVMKATGLVTNLMTNAGVFLFIPVCFITFSSAVASLRKDRIGKKVVTSAIIWALVTSIVLALLGICAVRLLSLSFPVTASAGGDYVSLFSSYSENLDTAGVISLMNSIFFPMIVLALFTGMAVTPTSDVIRPAYTVFNSLSEAMYRIERCVTYFGSFYVYLAGTSFFISLWQEKTAFVAPSFFIRTASASLAVILVVLPLLYAFFTSFRKNPYEIILKDFTSLITAFVSGNIHLASLQNEAISRNSMGVQKRIVSTLTPLGIIMNRGGTCFISTLTVLSLLSSLNAEVSVSASLVIALVTVLISFLSPLSAGCETALVTIVLFKVLNISVFGAEAAVISVIPFLNGFAAMIDITLISMSSGIAAVRTKTDVTIPVRDAL